MPVHISCSVSRSYSCSLGCMHGKWRGMGNARTSFLFTQHPQTPSSSAMKVSTYRKKKKYAQTLVCFVLRTQQICIQSKGQSQKEKDRKYRQSHKQELFDERGNAEERKRETKLRSLSRSLFSRSLSCPSLTLISSWPSGSAKARCVGGRKNMPAID